MTEARAGRTGFRVAASAICVAAMLSGCTRPDRNGGLNFPFLPGYQGTRDGAPVLLDNAAWWRGLDDPVLDGLIAQALAQNLTLAAATERVRQALAEAGTVPDGIDATPSLSARVEGDTENEAVTTGTAQIGFDWMLDPFGARKAARAAAAERVNIAEAEADAARLLVLFNTANAYAGLRYRERLLDLREQELQSRRRTLALVRDLAASDAAIRLEVTRSRARVAEIEAQLPQVRSAVQASRNQIAVLVGQIPGQFTLPQATPGRIPQPQLSPDVGIPADLLRNRPDIRSAERSYYLALADLEAAEAARYPSLSLGGAISLGGGNRGVPYYFGPTVRFPDLIGNTTGAAIAARQSAVRQAHAFWQSTVLDAILEVENALLDYRAATEAVVSAGRAVALYQQAADLTREIFGVGDATLTDLIDAEQAIANARILQADSAYNRALGFIALNVRVGAGSAAR
ncbi:efflux transporter outer membrane subunit [Loktanella sp. DJP18]|uniref:efflux transporter outer membrane subunit n=1 Tax=Loktanella sp. DJP18 TaxID=3409788 RepID=UPI003BB780B9